MRKTLFLIAVMLQAIFPVIAQEDFNLISTNTLDGMKCEHYAEGFRIYRHDDGGYMCFNEAEFYTDYEMSNHNSPDSKIWGTFKFQTKEGITIERSKQVKNEDGVDKVYYAVTFIYPNGSRMYNHFTDEEQMPYISNGQKLFNAFKTRSFKNLWTYHHTNHREAVYESADKTKRLKQIGWGEYGKRDYGYFKDGDRLYKVRKNGTLMNVAQIVKVIVEQYNDTIDIAQPVTESDTIISTNNGIIYASGDKLSGGNLSIHRNGNLITRKKINGKIVSIIKYANGDKFVGQRDAFAVEDETGDKYLSEGTLIGVAEGNEEIITASEIFPWNGLMTKADGTSYNVKWGQTPEMIAAQKELEKRKNEAAYQKLCKDYGKQNVDAAVAGRIIVGMPEEILLTCFKAKLMEEGDNYKLYRIYGFGIEGNTITNRALQASVWMRNGKVSSIKYWQ